MLAEVASSREGVFAVSEIDIRALEALFEGWWKERAPQLEKSKAFEWFTVEQVLKDSELSDEQISSGLFGGSDDGGIDGMYFFINRTLIEDETELPDPAILAELFLIQSKYEQGFGEHTVDRMHAFMRDLLDYSKSVDSLTYLNSIARDAIARFRSKYNDILSSRHELKITLVYTSKSDQDPNNKVIGRVNNLKAYVRGQLSAALVDFEFWGAGRLVTAARTTPTVELMLEVTKYFSTHDKSTVCLVKLKDFAAFLTDDHGNIRRSLLEPNVRDYGGKRNPVNTDIRTTLGNPDGTEFWWLNNGITILAADCSIAGDRLKIVKPEIVNGLQTSYEVFTHFKGQPASDDPRNVLIRVIVPPKEQTRNRITKATNFQTVVDAVYLHATDPIHFDIEERLKLYGLFYERRKSHYRNLRKPISQIVNIHDMARVAIAVLLREPNNARGGPQKRLNNPDVYPLIFGDDYNRDVYVTCILLDRQVETFLNAQENDSKEKQDEHRDIRYYMDLILACELTQSAKPRPRMLASLAPKLVNPLPDAMLNDAFDLALPLYRGLGGTDKVAKGTELTVQLIAVLNARYPDPHRQFKEAKNGGEED